MPNSRSQDVGENKTKEKRSGDDKTIIVEMNSYVSLNRGILGLVGLHPKNRAKISTVAFLMLLIVVPQVSQIYQSRDLGVILETSSVLLTIILAILKIIIWSVRQNEINDLITYAFGDYWNIVNFEERSASSFLRYAGFSRAFTKCYLFLVTNSLVLFCGLPLIQISISMIKGSVSEKRVSLFPGLYPEGWTVSPFYEITLLSQILATSSCGAVILAIDTFIAMALFHTCGHFKIIQANLHSLGDFVSHIEDRMDEESLRIQVKRKLRDHIEHHQIVLRFCGTLERVFNPIMLCQVSASVMIICLVGLQVSATLAGRDKLLKYMSYLLMALFQLALFCLPGDDLINQSLAVSDAAYATNWYRISKLLKTDVIFIIVRSQRPAKITAGKFTVMSLEHLGAVLSTSMSYFTVFRSFS